MVHSRARFRKLLVVPSSGGGGDSHVEMIAESRNKMPYVLHITLCLRLMTHLWRKGLSKFAEHMFSIPTGLSV